MEKGAVFPLFYLPNVEFFSKLKKFKEEGILLEQMEHFPKQTYRNRTSISGPNGILDLTVPILKGPVSNRHTLYKDIKIANQDNWQRIHWLSLGTSYRSSSYFEFYEDDFAPFYEKKYEFLLDYNMELLSLLLKQLKMPLNYQLTESFEKNYAGLVDLRGEMQARKPSNYLNKPYFQVFEDRVSYQNNLSVIDLLFSQGPQASKYF
ncbi:MAG: WbqC family protein [Pelobium sp.]